MSKSSRRWFAALRAFVLCLGLIPAVSAQAQTKIFPDRPVTFIVPWGAGGGSDQVAREIARLLSDRLKTSVVVVNVPGANGTIGIAKLVNSPADGYTIGLMAADTYALLAGSPPPDQWNDAQLLPLAVMIKQTNAIIVASDSPYQRWSDLVAEAKRKPDSVSIAVGGVGSPQDLTINSLRSQGTSITVIPYAKPGERYSAVMGHQVGGFYEALGNVKPLLDSKRVRPLLVFTDKRVSEYPNVETSAEVGIDVTLPQFRAVVIRKDTDPKIIQVIGDALREVAASEDYKRYLSQQLADRDSYMPGREAATFMREQLEIMKGLAKAASKAS